MSLQQSFMHARHGSGRHESSGVLLNGQKLDGVDALKRFLLKNRHDQFTRAMVHKMTTFA